MVQDANQLPPEPPSKTGDTFAADAPADDQVFGRSHPDAGGERLSVQAQDGPLTNAQDGPLTNAQVRGTQARPVVDAVPDEIRVMLQDAEERLRRQTLGEAGEEPQSIQHHVNAPLRAGGAPGTFYGQSTTYVYGERDIFASSIGQIITSYTLDSSAITADGNGDKVVYEGTVLQASGAKVAPRTSGTAVGISRHRINARNGDVDIGMIVGGRIRSDKCWDNGTFGTIAGGAITSLNALGIYFTTYDD